MTHVAHGVLRLDVTQDLSLRMRELAMRLQGLLQQYEPQQGVLEDVFVSEGVRSALILGQARGAVLATLGLGALPVSSLSTTSVKLTIAGTGRATKLQVGEMVRLLLGLDKKPAEDASDALALALCHAHRLLGPVMPTTMPAKKRLSSKQKRDALYDLALKQGKV
jgi:crossover junction endodeoxyribonuclease RuvC